MTTLQERARYEMYGPVLVAEVRGVPVPQGSIRSLGRGRPSIHSNAARLLPWREQVQHAFEDPANWHLGGGVVRFPLDGPVAVNLTFTMAKPKSAPKRRRIFPVTRPDTDKLLRCVLDAGTNAGLWRDDSQVVQVTARKVYPGEHPQALDVPGLLAFVYTVGSD